MATAHLFALISHKLYTVDSFPFSPTAWFSETQVKVSSWCYKFNADYVDVR